MENETIDSPIIDPNLDSYNSFFDHDWCGRIFTLAAGSPLKAAVDTLMLAWRSTAGAHRLPWLLVEQLRGFAEGEVKGNLRYRASYSATVVQGISDKLEARTPSLDFKQRLEQRHAVAGIEEEAFQALKTARSHVQFDIARYWDSLIREWEFCVCILGVQRTNYASLFFAYEDFLASTIKATKDPNYSSKTEKTGPALARHFGNPLADDCWNDAEVDLARLVRNAVAHNSGRLGTELDKHRARFVDATGTTAPVLEGDRFNVVNGTIQITPCNTRFLFGILKDRVTRIVEELT